ncbi:hypothetical protein K2173_018175 [Erythroxylum novogranatense]|uniref:Uncharacterized protein n=1 Tax=Erythroxylum novogranatense TaxID=1862640 RepID=A0AAV8TL09_9ROSI|nr:hypothetical protein K2173_018175 [Erythroxylum novogranatense]
MTGGWVKSLQCKSRAFEDVLHPHPTTRNLISSSSCKKGGQSIKDVIEATVTAKHKPSKPRHHKPVADPIRPPPQPRTRSTRSSDQLLPALTELPEGHPSRNVVEIIFHTSWSNKSFPGRIEMIFKVQNGSRTMARFEEYREKVKSRAGLSGGSTWEENARCMADGNEMMRFHCLGAAGGGAQEAGGCTWVFPGGKGSAICTFSGSGGAHESAGCGRGRRAMLVCRVIAGRVSKKKALESLLDGRRGFDSLSGDNGELLVFDSKAVLRCFLIIYKL